MSSAHLHIVGQLEHLAREAAAHYRTLCLIEGDDSLQVPHNHYVLEGLLSERRESLSKAWER